MEFLTEYGMFLAKVVTIVAALIVVIIFAASIGQRSRRPDRKGKLRVTCLNEHFEEIQDGMRFAVLDKGEFKRIHKEQKKKHKDEQKKRKAELKKAAKDTEDTEDTEDDDEHKEKPAGHKRVFVLNFTGNMAADAVDCLREEISAILSLASSSDEVLLRLESPGGMVNAYGLASSQLVRLRKEKIPLTVCVDKVAASGGYMMACLADKLVAAPFAIIGSIGVLVQLPNFHRVLKKNHVDFEIIAAGEFKRTLTTFGEITQKGRDKVQEDVESIHGLFKNWVKEHRPGVEIDRISTGETWVGTQAKDRDLVDELKTSDECILEACAEAEVFEVEYELRKSIRDRFGRVLEESIDRTLSKWFERSNMDNYQ